MSDLLPWDHDKPLSLRQLLKNSMRSVNTLSSSNSLLDKMSTHLNGLLRQQEPIVREDDPRSVQVFHNMFLNAARNMESDKDKQTLALLQRQVVSFLGVSLGISAFEEHGRNLGLDDAVNDDDDDDDDDEKEENKLSWSTAYSHEESHKAGENSSYSAFREAQKKSWTERPEDYDDNKIDIFGPERAERERLRQLSIDDEENREEEEEDDEEDEEDDGEEEVEEVQVKSREINQGGNDGFKVVSRKQKKKKAPRPSYNNNNNNNNYQRNDQRYSRPSNNYYKQSYTRRPAPICSFHPDYLERLSGETFCMPIFFPSEDSYSVFHSALGSAKQTLDVCVFSLTDNDTANVIIDAHKRGVRVRIITDNDQMDSCKGADAVRLNEQYGIPLKYDDSNQFMHNKFAVMDSKTIITGSFNWSIGARFKNRENVIVTNIPSVVQAYDKEFEHLWSFF